jgi:hypothetical protein
MGRQCGVAAGRLISAGGGFWPKRMDFSGARAEVEKLLKCFLVGTQNVILASQILDIGELPAGCRERVRAAQALGRAWTAWSTERGAMAAWATYDTEGSRRLKAHVLFVEWCAPPCEYHAAWCRCSLNRPTEWIFGRGPIGDEPC